MKSVHTCNIDIEALEYQDDQCQDCLGSSHYRSAILQDYENYFVWAHNDGDRHCPWESQKLLYRSDPRVCSMIVVNMSWSLSPIKVYYCNIKPEFLTMTNVLSTKKLRLLIFNNE